MASLKKFRVKKDMGGYSYPYTHIDLVFDDNNQSLTEKLEKIQTDGYDDTHLRNLIDSKVSKEYVDEALQNVEVDTSGFALKTDIPDVPTKISEFENDSGYMTGIPSNYVTEDMLVNKGYISSIPEDYATKDYVMNQISGALKIQQVTESQYNEMVTKEPNTLYIIIED